jgi:hypothetical protein
MTIKPMTNLGLLLKSSQTIKKCKSGGYCPGCEKASPDLWTEKDPKTGIEYWRCGVCGESGKLDVVSLMEYYKNKHPSFLG